VCIDATPAFGVAVFAAGLILRQAQDGEWFDFAHHPEEFEGQSRTINQAPTVALKYLSSVGVFFRW